MEAEGGSLRKGGLPPQGGAGHPFPSGRCPGEPSLGAGSAVAPMGGCAPALAVAFASFWSQGGPLQGVN